LILDLVVLLAKAGVQGCNRVAVSDGDDLAVKSFA
jgi:hypothetical protein